MKVEFRKLTANPQMVELSWEQEGRRVVLKGELFREKSLARFRGVVEGTLHRVCDSCGEEYDAPVSESLELLFSDGPFETSEQEREHGAEMLDVIETEGGFIDMEKLLESEIQLILCEYHKCEICQEKE